MLTFPAFREIHRVLKPDSFCATFYGWPWVDRFMAAWRQAGFRPVSHLVWVKSHCSRAGYTRGQHEVGYLLAKGRPPLPARPLSDLLPWAYTGNRFHPNEKPICAIQPLIETFSRTGETVLDPFSGSGTTGVVAHAAGRRFILIEKLAEYRQSARDRLPHTAQALTSIPLYT